MQPTLEHQRQAAPKQSSGAALCALARASVPVPKAMRQHNYGLVADVVAKRVATTPAACLDLGLPLATLILAPPCV